MEGHISTPQTSTSIQTRLDFLQDPRNFQEITSGDIPQAFLGSENQPPVGTSLALLLHNGHFRRAAETALDDLLKCDANNARSILELLYTRLACLVLISRPDIAAQEAHVLTDFLARSPPEAEYVVPLVPWELRLLLVRLQSLGATDEGRRGIMSLYGLATEVRRNIYAANEDGRANDPAIWNGRLRDLGLRVADMLVEMGELETATRHLDTLIDVPSDELVYRKALLRLRVGDLRGVQQCINQLEDGLKRSSFEALVDVSNDKFESAVQKWRSQMDTNGGDGLAASNLAVALLYTGRIGEAKDILESFTQQSAAFPGLLYNLSTVYELCTEQAVHQKAALAQRMADKTPTADTGGWERSTFEFKL